MPASNAVPMTPAQDSSRCDLVTTNKAVESQPVSNNKPVEHQPVNEILTTSVGKTKKVKYKYYYC